jgi:hypothetical protein
VRSICGPIWTARTARAVQIKKVRSRFWTARGNDDSIYSNQDEEPNEGSYMDRSKNRKFVTWNAAQLALRKMGVPFHGAVATLLLEAFLENDGRLLASTIYARGLCEEKQFREWRKNLIDKQWLIWCETQTDKGVYFPGKKLILYINREKLAQKEIATRESVEKVQSTLFAKIETKADRSELEDLKKRMTHFEKLAQRLEAATGDPITIEKIADQKACAAEMKRLALAN